MDLDNLLTFAFCENSRLDDDREGWSDSDYEKAEKHLLESTCEKCGKEEFRCSESDDDIIICDSCGFEILLGDWMDKNPEFFEYEYEPNLELEDYEPRT